MTLLGAMFPPKSRDRVFSSRPHLHADLTSLPAAIDVHFPKQRAKNA